MPAQVHIGDIGTVFEATVKDQDGVVVNISTAASKQLIFKKPDASTMIKNASFVTTGTDGKMKYVTTSVSDLDQEGNWELQGFVSFGVSEWHTDTIRFRVYDNLA